jgi:long-chain acyl-CoA synthetase
LPAIQYRLADRFVLANVRRIFGDKFQMGLVGAAPVAPELLEFFDACGVLVLEGYGLSETCAAATLNTPGAVRFGIVGKPLPGTEVLGENYQRNGFVPGVMRIAPPGNES